MLKNYFKTSIRNIKVNKSYALINVSGLAVGIAACLLLFLVIQFETSFDDFHPQHKKIYRIGSMFNSQEGTSYSGGVSFPVAPALRVDFPQIKQVASIYKHEGDQITVESYGKNLPKKFNKTDVYFTEPEFFSMFKFSWLTGDAKTSLSEPNNAVLTREIAEKYFGDWESAMGKTITRNNKELYKINGVLDNPPQNTDFPLGVVVSYSTLSNTIAKINMEDWVSTYSGACSFVILPDDLPVQKFNNELPVFAKRHKPAEYAKDTYIAQSLDDIHYDDRFGNFRRHTFSHSLIRALMLIGIFLIFIACVNFINLATAQAVNRSKEVGVRKVLGSNRSQLAFQFITETALITFAAVIAAIGIAIAVLPLLNQLLEVKMTMNFYNNSILLLFLSVVGVLVTLLSGLYPAVILSGFNPITALKSKISTKKAGGISLRRALVVLQFGIAQILIIGTLIVLNQMNFFRNASLGFDKAAIINVDIPGDSISKSKIEYLRFKLQQNPGIKNISFSFASPSSNGSWQSDFKFDHSTKSTDISANLKWADVDYFKTYGLEFVAGRQYFPGDTVREFVVNETMVKKLGIINPADAIGKELNFWDGEKVGPIVGIVKDFNSYSLREPMAPVVMSTWKNVYQTINIKIKPGAEKNTLAFVEKNWNEVFPDYVYQYKFLDETIADFYKQEDQLSKLFTIFAILAIFISCLGLYGLVSFMVAQRTKEVGIRKVLGATVGNIVYLLSKEFSLLIIIAFVLAAPIANFIMKKWLQDYSYRIEFGVTVFLIAIFGSLIIAWTTVGYRAIKAALANPVKSLRTE
ncbi:MAG: ABC transporter permease [Saprospiraceae bacterium]|jgi:predicted permease|nr:ABC transporter permease [Saprospiraceae bacterium]